MVCFSVFLSFVLFFCLSILLSFILLPCSVLHCIVSFILFCLFGFTHAPDRDHQNVSQTVQFRNVDYCTRFERNPSLIVQV